MIGECLVQEYSGRFGQFVALRHRAAPEVLRTTKMSLAGSMTHHRSWYIAPGCRAASGEPENASTSSPSAAVTRSTKPAGTMPPPPSRYSCPNLARSGSVVQIPPSVIAQ